jgi:hypothetical protein
VDEDSQAFTFSWKDLEYRYRLLVSAAFGEGDVLEWAFWLRPTIVNQRAKRTMIKLVRFLDDIIERCTPAGTNPFIYIGIVYSDDWLSDCKPPGMSHFGESIRKPLGSTEYEFNIMSCVDTDSAAPTIPAAATPTITPDEEVTRPISDNSPVRSYFYPDGAMMLGFVDMSVAELVEDIK